MMTCKQCPFFVPVEYGASPTWTSSTYVCLLGLVLGENYLFEDCGYPRGPLGPEKFDELRAELIGALTGAADRLRDAQYYTREM